MYIALDANVWLTEKLLRSATGAAFLHAVRRLNWKILLPDSTREEILAGVVTMGTKASAQVECGFLTIQALTGKRPGLRTLSDKDFRAAAAKRLDELNALIKQCEITLDHFNRALTRVNEHRAPAATREQFRDCLLWECLLDYKGNRVLVSSDGDFLDKSGGTKSLAPELVKEGGSKLAFFINLKDALRAIEPQLPAIDQNVTAAAIEAVAVPMLLRSREHWPFVLGERIGTKIELYATEQTSTAVVFNLTYRIHDLKLRDGSVAEEAIARMKGECLLSELNVAGDLKMDGIEFASPDGTRLPGGVGYLQVRPMVGEEIPYEVRTPVPLEPA